MRPYDPKTLFVEIEPGTLPVDVNKAREDKIRSAIAKLGDKWVLRDTRQRQIKQLKEEGWDLV